MRRSLADLKDVGPQTERASDIGKSVEVSKISIENSRIEDSIGLSRAQSTKPLSLPRRKYLRNNRLPDIKVGNMDSMRELFITDEEASIHNRTI